MQREVWKPVFVETPPTSMIRLEGEGRWSEAEEES